MTEEKQKIIGWDEALTQKGEFLKFEKGERKKICITNWQIVEVEKQDFNDKDKMVIQPQFEADVVSENDEACEKRISILSKRFMEAVRPFLEGNVSDGKFYLKVKKIGESTSTNYDVEEYTPGD